MIEIAREREPETKTCYDADLKVWTKCNGWVVEEGQQEMLERGFSSQECAPSQRTMV